jgi:predicted component of type VI protein secretion system
MTVSELKKQALPGTRPPATASEALQVLWLCQAAEWNAAHEIAQDMPGALGARLHGLLHLIEGDEWNANYWFRRAGAPERRLGDQVAVWEQLAAEILPQE